jgi:tetratricopeptide (TPR) repeat protein
MEVPDGLLIWNDPGDGRSSAQGSALGRPIVRTRFRQGRTIVQRIDSPVDALDCVEIGARATVDPRRATCRGALRRLRLVCALAAVVVLAALATTADALPQKPPGLAHIPGPLPTSAPDILILADSLVRGGHLPEARILLNQVIEQFPNTAWARWGELGLGFLELARGRMVEARPYYEAATGGGFQDTARVVLALLDAQDGKTAEATAVLDALANDPSQRPPVQEAAGLGSGYVRYWAGAYDRAALAFAAVADRHPGSPLADDALYGLAQSFLQLGDPMSAEQVLERISEMPAQGFDDAHVRPALRKLSLREILRATRERYDSVPLGQADQMLIALLDVNGRVLATGSLAALAKRDGRTAAGTNLGDAARSAAVALARLRKATHLSSDAPMGTSPAGARRSDGVAAASERDASDPATASADGTPQARQHRGSAGGAGGLGVLALLATVIVLVVRPTGLPTFR